MGPLGLNFSVLTITPLSLSVTNTQAATEKNHTTALLVVSVSISHLQNQCAGNREGYRSRCRIQTASSKLGSQPATAKSCNN